MQLYTIRLSAVVGLVLGRGKGPHPAG